MIRTRDDSTTARTFGTWPEDDGSVVYQTMEPGIGPELFSPGNFTLRLRYSPHHGHAVFGYKNVPGHQDEEVHAGNRVRDTLGCTILGMTRGTLGGEDAVLQSGVALDTFMAKRGCPEYRTLTSEALVDAWIAAHPDLAEVPLTVA